jgi:mannitol-1-/sugar-/sorbitol-6-phosphatase
MSAATPVLATCEALLVDLDGTLLDTTLAVEASWRNAAAELDVDFALFEPFLHGIPAIQVIDQVLPGLDVRARSRLADRVLADQAREDAVVRWMPGAQEFLANLTGIPWAVVTSGTRRLATASMRKVGMAHPPVLVTADDVGIGKPHPAPFLRAAYLLSMSPSDCVAIEDSPAGVSSARQAGMRVLGVVGTNPAARLRNASVVLTRLPGVDREPDSRRVVLTGATST